jgi:hypothetical protein
MQPLLLLKQTLEATYDPGPLLLDGPNVSFTDADQFLALGPLHKRSRTFNVGLSFEDGSAVTSCFAKGPGGLKIAETVYQSTAGTLVIRPEMSRAAVGRYYREIGPPGYEVESWEVKRRCFLELTVTAVAIDDSRMRRNIPEWSYGVGSVRNLLHLPGARSNRDRMSPATGVGPLYPGTFETYTAAVVERWQKEQATETLGSLGEDLAYLGLTRRVVAVRASDAQLEIRIGRTLNHGNGNDSVSLADAGFGVGQVLPVLVALRVAKEGQLVYVEDPEADLHPRAQVRLAKLLADAAKRGVILVVETHSSLLLQGIATLVAEGKLDSSLVKLHWFQRGKSGLTKIHSADLDRQGRHGKWPSDFHEVILDSESAYLDAVSADR